jgi:hypothetical protein
MRSKRTHNWLLATGFALLSWSGCSTDYVRMYEQRGEHYKAHQLCREALTQDPQNQAAAAGLLRNAPAALKYWRAEALAAATTNDWRRAAVCHQQVLMIKPNEKASIDALRRLAGQHPDQIALPIRPDAVATTALVKPSAKVALAAPPSAKSPASTSPEVQSPRPQRPASPAMAATPPPTAPAPTVKTAAKPVDQPRPVVKRPTKVASAPEPVRPKPAESKTSEAGPPQPQRPASSAIASVATPQAPRKQTVATRRPTAPAPQAKTVAKRPDKPQRPARVARRVNPYRQRPTVRREGKGVSETEMALVVHVSKDDPRYAEKALLTDGIFVRVKDTGLFSLNADMELYLGNRRVAKLTNLRTGSVVTVLGRSGEPYELVLMHIDGGPDTVKIGLRRPRHADSGIGQLAAGLPR